MASMPNADSVAAEPVYVDDFLLVLDKLSGLLACGYGSIATRATSRR